MPSESQNMLEDQGSVTTTGDLGERATARLRQAFSYHEKSIHKSGATINFEIGGLDKEDEVTPIADLVGETLSSANLKTLYATHVKRGLKSIPGSGFVGTAAANLDYDGAPELGALGAIAPEGEEIPGGVESKGSTIASSGLGQNINIQPLGSIADREVVAPNYPGTDAQFSNEAHGRAHPNSTSTKHGAVTSIPGGDLGEGPAVVEVSGD